MDFLTSTSGTLVSDRGTVHAPGTSVHPKNDGCGAGVRTESDGRSDPVSKDIGP